MQPKSMNRINVIGHLALIRTNPNGILGNKALLSVRFGATILCHPHYPEVCYVVLSAFKN